MIKATSEASASGLLRRFEIDPKRYPIVQWRWKISNTLKKGDITKKQGDDYPARLYITFADSKNKLSWMVKLINESYRIISGQYPPQTAISYVWGNKSPVDTIASNIYSDRVKMIVVESGTHRLNQWVQQERNIYQDYMRAFGKTPSRIIGIAIMTDTDNTGESATAYYGDIRLVRVDRQ